MRYATHAGMIDGLFQELMNWQQQEKGRRSISIEVGSVLDPNLVKVWVFDHALLAGCFVAEVGDLPNDEQLREKRKASLLLELKQMEVAA